MVSGNGAIIHRKPIETVTSSNGLELSLLAAGDGTEVIRHRMQRDTRWAIETQDGWTACEMLMIISGTLSMLTSDGDVLLSKGDILSATPILEDTVFHALTDVEFIYISSQPVFHFYSKQPEELKGLAIAVAVKDGYTAEHCERILALSMLVGETMGLGSKEMLQLNYGAFLHDVGKVQIPDEILQKPAQLTADEWQIMRKHTDYGAQMLIDTQVPALQAAADIVRYHHERWDGLGYHGLCGADIPIGACVVAVVDSYDAMTTDRVYQRGRSKEEALVEILNCRGKMYRPDVVDAFIALRGKLA